jgi:hypothetical protein
MLARARRPTRWVRLSGMTFVLVCIACRAPFAAELERVIPVAKDRCGNELKVEITGDRPRQTATPTASLADPTIGRIRQQIERATGMDLRQDQPTGETVDSVGTPRPEITARDVRCLFRALRDAVKERRAPASPPNANGEAALTDSASAEQHAAAQGNAPAPAGRN